MRSDDITALRPSDAKSTRENLLGWGTDLLVDLDALAPGLISRVITAAPQRRQAIFSVLASRVVIAEHDAAMRREEDADERFKLAHVLRGERARDILAFAFREVPDGWLGALERLGGRPLQTPRSYLRLQAVFARPANRKKAEALRYVGTITESMLRVVDALDERWLHCEVLNRVESSVAAQDFNRAVAFAQSVCTRATDAAVVEAISRLPPHGSLANLVSRYVRRADRFPDHPLDHDDEVRPLASTRDIIEVARRYRNCLAAKIDDVLVGRVAFAEFRVACVLEFRPLSHRCGWVLWDIHVPHNATVPKSLSDEAMEACANRGIPHLTHGTAGEDWRRYRRFLRHSDAGSYVG